MSSDQKPIVLDIPHGKIVEYRLLKTGETGTTIVTNGRLHMSKNKLYYIPITDSEISLDESYVIKPIGTINENLDIRNVDSGFVAVIPILNNVILKDGTLLGYVI